jgi:hypothetical protein
MQIRGDPVKELWGGWGLGTQRCRFVAGGRALLALTQHAVAVEPSCVGVHKLPIEHILLTQSRRLPMSLLGT